MDTELKPSQQEQDRRAQKTLTDSVGVRLERQEKPDRSPVTAIKRLFRIGSTKEAG